MKVGGMDMNGGEGPNSYARNSSYQRGVLEIARKKIEEQIDENTDVIKQIVSSGTTSIGVADFGCATGHNSFPAVETITQSLHKNIAKHISLPIPEIVVFFNDMYSNDFNTLFSSLPRERNYHAVGLPGGFHGRLLPKSSLRVAYSSWSLHWLTEVPKEVVDPASLAWNKGSIIWTRDREDVRNAYVKQYVKDMGSFLEARTEELVGGGMMALLIPGVPNSWDVVNEYTQPCDINLLGSCLMDLAKEGKISEDQVDLFNVPYYFATPNELNTILHQKSHLFTIETMEVLDNPGKHTIPTPYARAAFFRAVHEKLIADHFGSGIVDELFLRYEKKLAGSPVFLNPSNDKSIVMFVILKRKLVQDAI